MSRTVQQLLGVLAISVILSVCNNVWAQNSITGEEDIAALMVEAERSLDLDQEDGVFLFAGQKVLWHADGRLTTTVHEIVWINSELAVRRYADRRVPYDHEHCSFTASTVRTWRDGQWWPTGESGIVETLPFAVRTAYDYTTAREMMLLHNGVEVPCILEVFYTIEDRAPFRQGADGLWAFQRQEPVIRSQFVHGVPPGAEPRVAIHADVPLAERGTDTVTSLDTYTWRMGPLDALGRPHVDGDAMRQPYVLWSTWPDWSVLARFIRTQVAANKSIDGRLNDVLDSLRQESRTDDELIKLVAQYIVDNTRFINIPERDWWHFPRSARTTFATAYGHRLDRAILGIALLEQAGLSSGPVFIADGIGDLIPGVPSLGWSSGISVRVKSAQADRVLDPVSGSLIDWAARTRSRVVWDIATSSEPSYDQPNTGSEYDIRLDVEIDAKSGKLTGSGVLRNTHAMCQTSRAIGVSGEMKKYLLSVATSLINGAKLDDYSPSVLSPETLVVGFELSVDSLGKDSLGRYRLELGAPSGGLLDCLPADIALFHQSRGSAVILPTPMSQRIELRIKTKGLNIVYSPETVRIENNSGVSYSVSAKLVDEQLIVVTECELKYNRYEPDDWSDLRSCLVRLTSPATRTLLWVLASKSG